MVSASIPITEAVIPARYPESWLDQTLMDPKLVNDLQQAEITESLSELKMQNGMELLYGRALYPRYYGPKGGIPGNAWYAFVPRDYARLGFYLLGSIGQNVVLPLEEKPTYFPHASDVIILGCSQDEFFEAQLVVLMGDEMNIIFQRVPQPNWKCSEVE